MTTLLQDLERSRFTRRGMADALDGKVPASEHDAYSQAFAIGALFRRATQREIALVFGMGQRCEQCGNEYGRGALYCLHSDGRRFAVEPGLFVCHGPADQYDEPEFMTGDRLRQLAASGIPVYDKDGDCITPAILTQ